MKISKRHLLNYSILVPYLLLSILGLIVVYSTTSAILIQEGQSALQLVRSQGLFWIFSLILIALIYKLKLNFLRNWTSFIYRYVCWADSFSFGSFDWYSCQWSLWLDFCRTFDHSASWVFEDYYRLVLSSNVFQNNRMKLLFMISKFYSKSMDSSCF